MSKMSVNYNDRKFKAVSNSETGEVSGETVFHYHQDGDVFWAEYSGGAVVKGFMVGTAAPDGELRFHYQHLNGDREVRVGSCVSRPELLSDGRIRLHEEWQWADGGREKGVSIVDEML